MTEIDEQFFQAVMTENIEEMLRLHRCGANVNAMNGSGDNVVMEYLQMQEKPNIEIIQRLIELGVDTNFENEGFNCLFNAYLSNRSDIVECLLKAGASAQCISTDTTETLLDWIEFDIRFEKSEHSLQDKWFAESEKIVQLLKAHGARTADECFAKTVEEYLKMFGGYRTGLFTKKGNIHIRDLPNITNEIVEDFNKWHKTAAIFSDKTWNREEIDIDSLTENNRLGKEVAMSIKTLLPIDIKIRLNSIVPENYQSKKARNIQSITV